MTDKTYIAALTRPVRDRYDWSNAVWRDCDQCGKQHTGTVTAEDGSQICAHCADQLYWSAWQVLAERALDQLEAERHKGDLWFGKVADLEAALKAERQRAADLVLHVNTQANMREKTESELAALKGEQMPVAVVELNDNLSVAELRGDIPRRKAVRELYEGALVLGQELFGAPQRPVISKAKLCDWLEDNFDIDDSQRDAFANCFAHHCNCIVKDGD
ncbi:hypothetical protein AB6896_15860 [Rahnella inusitata]|uniref:hypothetical protein n=1 Tax=Rahnella inusitata TaxID=58169 RepID=UPI0039BEA25E